MSEETTSNTSKTDTPKTAAPKNGSSKFDWVTARSSCSLANVFKTLRLQVEEDVKTRNALRPANSPYEFSVAESNGGFAVVLKGKELKAKDLKAKDVQRSVVFTQAEHAISVYDGIGSPMFDVTLAFDEAGDCKLNVNGESRDFWQVRRMALEELLFPSL
jgi:hypothetical protein